MKMYVSTFFLWFVISLGAVANAKSDPVKLIVPAGRFLESLDRLKKGEYNDACVGGVVWMTAFHRLKMAKV